MKKALICFFSLLHLYSYSQNKESYRIAFYNVENLFDIENDSLTRDDEFTADGLRNWGFYRYQGKLHRTAKAILAIGGWKPAPVIGLAEIENRKVLEDLILTDELKKHGYKIIHFESQDKRGIDVGLLYLPKVFSPIYSQNINATLKSDSSYTTRDILYTKGSFEKDTLHLFFCHWPSRYGGQQKSEPRRIIAAQILRQYVDSILEQNAKAQIIIAGDFNDEWDNQSLSLYLKAKKDFKPNDSKNQLINLMASNNANKGSHKYKGVWSYLDQIIVSSNLLNPKSHGLYLKTKNGQILEDEFLLESDSKYPGKKPFRTFVGYQYHRGFSDHLPIYIDLISF